MAAILRWTYLSGKRHRVYLRNLAPNERRELVVAGPGWESAVTDVTVNRLEDLSEEALVDIVRRYAPAG
jgi:hypothetical protein